MHVGEFGYKSLLLELYAFIVAMGEDERCGEFKKTVDDLERGHWISTDPPMTECKKTKLSELLHTGHAEGLS